MQRRHEAIVALIFRSSLQVGKMVWTDVPVWFGSINGRTFLNVQWE